MTSSPELRLIGLSAFPEVTPGMNLAELARAAVREAGEILRDGDVLVVTHKIVAKAEGRLVDLRTVEPSEFARQWAVAWGKDPRHIEVVLRESVRVVRMDRGILISQTRHGFVCANAGVDASNVPGDEMVCLLPVDPDATAQAMRHALSDAAGAHIAVIIADSFGRPWRNGIVNVAIGAAGIEPLVDYRGQVDDFGRPMQVSVLAVADELASAAELVMGKVSRCPMALIRGYPYTRSADGESSARALIMDPSTDMFR
jgi:coenzyme F420-0:L-glutamate ligase / coenzyme F420-1:gamma-L-glutamate ligase